MTIGPHVAAWKAREDRRTKRLRAAIRVMLIDGIASDADLRTGLNAITGKYHDRSTVESLARSVGATTKQDDGRAIPTYTRTPTREDSIDAVLLREMGGAEDWCTFQYLLTTVAKSLGVEDAESIRKDAIDACDRVGVIPNTGSRFMLQTWEKM